MNNGSTQGFRDEIAPHPHADMQHHHRALTKFDNHKVRFGQPIWGELPIDAPAIAGAAVAIPEANACLERECGYSNMDAGRIWREAPNLLRIVGP